MPRTKISEFSATAADNTDIDGINIAEGCAPSVINNAIRELMSQLKDFQTGAGGDSFNGAIGSTTPAAGSFTTIGATGDVSIADKIIHTGDTNTAIRFPAADTVTVETSGVERLRIDTSGNLLLGSTTTPASNAVKQVITGGTSNYLEFISTSGGGGIVGNNGSNLAFFTLAGSIGSETYSERMRITDTGNIGIGTTSPQAKAVVSNGGAAGFEFFVNYPGGGLGTYIQSFSRSGGAYVDTAYDAATHSFRTSGTERMRITSAGFVGIGTTGPDSTLTVQGPTAQSSFTGATYGAAVLRGATATTNYTNLDFAGSSTVTIARIGMLFGASGSSLQFGTSNNYASGITNTAMTIAPSGNVGIFTASPDALLSVNGIASFGDGAAATPSIANFGDLNTGFWFPDADTIAASTAGAERVRITATGEIGIGTSTPSTYGILATAGNINNSASALGTADAATVSILNNNVGGLGTKASLTMNIAGIGKSVIAGYYAAFNGSNDIGTGLQFGTQTNAAGGTVERMRIDSAGNVGIGATANASALLDVQSTTKGVRMPNMTTTQKNAIASPAAGLMVFDTTLSKLCVYTGAAWQTITSA